MPVDIVCIQGNDPERTKKYTLGRIPSLESLQAFALGEARKRFKRAGRSPLWAYYVMDRQPPSPQHAMFSANYNMMLRDIEQRDAVFNSMRRLCALAPVVRFALVGEMWVRKDLPAQAMHWEGLPGNWEALLVAAESRIAQRVTAWELRRDQAGKAQLGRRPIALPGMAGRLLNILYNPPALPPLDPAVLAGIMESVAGMQETKAP